MTTNRDTHFLDAFRGGAALWVVLAHCMIWGGVPFNPIPDPKMAVDLFMMLSGFLMVFTMDRSGHDWRKFYTRRFFRIAPAYYVCLVLLAILAPLHQAGYQLFADLNPDKWHPHGAPFVFGIDNVLTHVAFVFGLMPRYAASTMLPDWSIGLEMQFYAVFPLIYVLLRRYSFLWVSLALTVLALALTMVYAAGVRQGVVTDFPEPSLLIFKLPYFVVGMLVYEGGWCLVVAALVLVLSPLHYGVLGLITVVMAGTMAWFWHGTVFRWLDALVRSGPIKLLADCSFSVYLFHGFFLTILGSRLLVWLLAGGMPKPLAVAVMAAAVVGAVYPFAWLSHRYIEQPGIGLGRWYAKRRGPRPAIRVETPV